MWVREGLEGRVEGSLDTASCWCGYPSLDQERVRLEVAPLHAYLLSLLSHEHLKLL